MCAARPKPSFERDILNSVLSSAPPSRPLYHYTTQDGILGIVQKREIWATHHQCLNDQREYLHAKELVRDEISKRLKAATGRKRLVLDSMIAALEPPGHEDVNLYVASFSEQPDSLSQWRAYGASTSGVALGFRCDHFLLPDGFRVVQCIYTKTAQLKIVRAIVSEVEKRSTSTAALLNVAPAHLRFTLHALALVLKHEAFKEEREWRIISPVLMDKAPAFPIIEETKLAFRSGKSVLTPYRRIPLKDDKGNFPLNEVVVGPNPNPKQACRSVQSLLNSEKGLDSVKVRNSDIPYRNW
jgi:hypothetical protein